jgi:hypothetical protein
MSFLLPIEPLRKTGGPGQAAVKAQAGEWIRKGTRPGQSQDRSRFSGSAYRCRPRPNRPASNTWWEAFPSSAPELETRRTRSTRGFGSTSIGGLAVRPPASACRTQARHAFTDQRPISPARELERPLCQREGSCLRWRGQRFSAVDASASRPLFSRSYTALSGSACGSFNSCPVSSHCTRLGSRTALA